MTNENRQKLDELFRQLKDNYGVEFDLNHQYKYEIEDDINNINGIFSLIEELLPNVKED